MGMMVCYCFEYTAEDIDQDVRRHDGESLILMRILEQKRMGACQCATKNPQGT
jgi:hypothetical protein